jgi:hypothetical protein
LLRRIAGTAGVYRLQRLQRLQLFSFATAPAGCRQTTEGKSTMQTSHTLEEQQTKNRQTALANSLQEKNNAIIAAGKLIQKAAVEAFQIVNAERRSLVAGDSAAILDGERKRIAAVRASDDAVVALTLLFSGVVTAFRNYRSVDIRIPVVARPYIEPLLYTPGMLSEPIRSKKESHT